MTKSCLICREAIHGCKSPSFDHAREDNGGSYSNEMVDGVLALLRVLPIFILVIMYWAVYAQVRTRTRLLFLSKFILTEKKYVLRCPRQTI